MKKPQPLVHADPEATMDGPYIELGKAHEVSASVISDGSYGRKPLVHLLSQSPVPARTYCSSLTVGKRPGNRAVIEE